MKRIVAAFEKTLKGLSLEKALMETEVPPMVDQIEFYPGMMQEETLDYCRDLS